MMNLQGSWVAMPTPFTEDNQVDIEGFKLLIARQIKYGTNQLFILGSAGEVTLLSIEEKKLIVKSVIAYMKDRAARGLKMCIRDRAQLELLAICLCTNFEHTTFNVLPEDVERRAIARRLLGYVEEHYASKLTLEDLADYAQYNRTYISTLFKQMVGINFHEYLTRVRFQHALNDLAGTHDNLTDIALRLSLIHI